MGKYLDLLSDSAKSAESAERYPSSCAYDIRNNSEEDLSRILHYRAYAESFRAAARLMSHWPHGRSRSRTADVSWLSGGHRRRPWAGPSVTSSACLNCLTIPPGATTGWLGRIGSA